MFRIRWTFYPGLCRGRFRPHRSAPPCGIEKQKPRIQKFTGAVYINDSLLFQRRGDMTPSFARRLFSRLGYRADTAWADNVWFGRMKKEFPAAMPQGFPIAWEKGFCAFRKSVCRCPGACKCVIGPSKSRTWKT